MKKNLNHENPERIRRVKMNLNQNQRNLNEIPVQKMMILEIKTQRKKGKLTTVQTMKK